MTTPTSPSPSSGTKKVTQAPRRRGGILQLLLLVGIIITISLFVWAEMQRREAQQRLSQTAGELEELRKSAQTSGQEVAKQVLDKLRRHIDIPLEPQPTVATIVDVDALKSSNDFYQPAENGDHLVITQKRAILYDPDRDIIIDVVPVSIDESQQAAGEPTPSGSPTGSPLAPTPAASPTISPAPAGLPTASPTPFI